MFRDSKLSDHDHDEAVPAGAVQGLGRFSRRRMLGGLVASGGLAVLGGGAYACKIEPTWVEVSLQTMPIPDLSAGFQGLRLIHISDLHVGSGVPLDYLHEWVNWVSSQNADLVVVTGDSVHYANAIGTYQVARLLGQLRAKAGVIVTLGNHEWGCCQPGEGGAGLAQRCVNACADQGVRVLRNEVFTLGRDGACLHIVGLDDYWTAGYDPRKAFARVPPGEPAIVMSHNPDSFIDLLDQPFSWMLSGHTHGGQVNLPLLGPPLLPVQHKEHVAGHYTFASKNLYVNRGLGWLRRIRFNARPEVTVFTLTGT